VKGIKRSITSSKLRFKQETAGWKATPAGDEVKKLRLWRDIEAPWWWLYCLELALALVSGNRDLLRQFVEIAKARYTVS
jgi:hypothetical protein